MTAETEKKMCIRDRGVKPAKVLILGGGIVGSNAAQMAAGMGRCV